MARLIPAIIIFLISLLTIFPAPAYFFWLLAIMVDEFPWAPIVFTFLFLLINLRSPLYPIVSNLLLAAALVLFMTPVVRARIIAVDLRAHLEAAFGPQSYSDASQKTDPLQIGKIFNTVKVTENQTIEYKSGDDYKLTMSFYPSALPGKRPCVIVVHGGSWKSGDNTQLPELNTILSREGYHVAAINYRLAPRFQSPAPAEDVKDAIRYLKRNAEKWQIDSNRFVLLGRSAGAQIALLAAYSMREPTLKGVIDFYGPADMVWGYSIPSNPLIMNSRKVMEDYLGGSYQKHPDHYESSSPILFASASSPPTLLIHGKNDVLVAYEHSRRLDERLKQLKVSHYLLTLPWATHGFDFNINGPGGQLSTYAVLYFLQSVTK